MALNVVFPILEFSQAKPMPLDFVLPGLVPGTVGGIVSPGGTGKSFFALQLSYAVSCPDANILNLPVTGSGPVLYVSAEDPKEVLHQRIYSISESLKALKQNDSDVIIEKVNENLAICLALACGINLVDPETKEPSGWVDELIEAGQGTRLIILDTLSRLHGQDENKAGEAKSVMRALEVLAKNTGAAVLYLHHVNKSAALEGKGDEAHAARGSGVFVDEARWCSFLKGMSSDEADDMGIDREERRKYVRWNINKQNYSAPEPDRWFKRAEGGVLLPFDIEEAGEAYKNVHRNDPAHANKPDGAKRWPKAIKSQMGVITGGIGSSADQSNGGGETWGQ